MTARRPNVPRAGRPLPTAEDGPAPGTREGSDAAHAPRVPLTGGAVDLRTGGSQRKPSVPRRAGPSATKDPRGAGAVAPKNPHLTGSSTHAPSLHRDQHLRDPHLARRPGALQGTPRPVKPASPSQARAAERSELAAGIRRGRLGSRRAESVFQPAEQATPVPAKTFSGRLLALALVVVVVIILLAPSVSRYFQQQAEVDALRAEITLQQELQAEYRSDLARWDDPAFVKQQARERIFLVMPGETRYLVKGGTGIEEGTGEGSAAGPDDLPWVDALWESVERAATD